MTTWRPFLSDQEQGKDAHCPTLLFNIVLEVLARARRQEEEIKDIQIREEEVKLSLFADVMVLYIENPEDSTKKVLELKNEFSEVKIYKVNTQISVESLYMNNNYQKEKKSHLQSHKKKT